VGHFIYPIVKKLADKRRVDEMSIHELSRKSGYSVDHLHKMEFGHRTPSLSALNAWAETLGYEVILKLKGEHDD
jgi:transcriptional regulator with XRE-family HTH domain